MADNPVLQLADLTKRYRKLVAVDELSLTVEAGQFVGLIGPNGAGKSTTMGCIAGTVAADEGHVEIDGVTVGQDPVDARQKLGYVPQHLTLLDYLTGLEYLQFVSELRGLSEERRQEEIDGLLAITELDEFRDTIVKEYSGGMLRKLAVAAALVGSPPLLVLDESFVGLDPESTHRLRLRLEKHCDEGGAILLSSHILDMLESLCDRFVFLVGGKLARDVTSDELITMRDAGEVDDLTDLYLQITGKKDVA